MESKLTQNKEHRWNIHKFYLLFFIFLICCIFYYFGEIVDFFNWDSLRWEFFYSVHDIHRLLFLVPIIYTAYYFGTRPTIIIILLTICAFLPRALFISPYPDPLLRASLFTVIAAVLGILFARECDRRKRLERLLEKDNKTGL
jgi:hypothetical protein